MSNPGPEYATGARFVPVALSGLVQQTCGIEMQMILVRAQQADEQHEQSGAMRA